jgi:succinoglycan biosynthesis transport protein ExoP
MYSLERPQPLTPPISQRSVRFENPLGDGANMSDDLLSVWGFLRRRLKIIAACTLLFSLIGTTMVLQIKPQYTAESSVMLDLRQQGVDVQAMLSGLPTVDMAVVRTEVDVLRSSTIAERVVKSLNLTTNQISSSVLGFFGFGTSKTTPTAEDEQAEVRSAVDAVLGATNVINDGRSYVLRIRATSVDPKLAADIANAYTDAYFVSQLESKFDSVRRANSWLNENLAEMRDKVETSAKAAQAFMAEKKLTSTNGTTIATQQIAELNSQLILASATRSQKESMLNQIRSLMKDGGVDSAAPVLQSPLIQELRKQETDLVRQEAQLSAKYRPEHPSMIKIGAQARDLREKIAGEINKIVLSLDAEVSSARVNEDMLRESLKTLQDYAAVQNEAWPQLQELERQANADRVLYENFLSRFKQTSTQETFQQADARLLAPAVVPMGPSYPRKNLMIGVSIVGAFIAALIIAFLVERLDGGFRTAEQIERLAQISTLGLVPEQVGGGPPEEHVISNPVSPFSEAIRTIRTSLRFSNTDNPPKVILVTSAMPEEGKTSFSLSLARSIVMSGKKVLIIDCDLRRPAIASRLGAGNGVAIPDIFDEVTSLDTAIQSDMRTGLRYIPAKVGAVNPQDVLGSRQMQALIQKMRSRYDIVILDTPPALSVSDAMVLSHMADAINLFRTHGANLAGVVISRVDVQRYATYGRSDPSYGYMSGDAIYGQAPTKAAS